MNRVVDRASRVQLQEDRMVLQLFPQDFVVDDHPGHRDPRNMLASRLEINVHLVTASMQEHNALVGAVNQAHLAVEETVFEALAACYAAVLPEDRREGIALVDIGAQSTELVVYYGDALAAGLQPADLRRPLHARPGAGVSASASRSAELVKLEYGCARSPSIRPANSLVEVTAPRDDRESRDTPRRVLNQISGARARGAVRHVRARTGAGGHGARR